MDDEFLTLENFKKWMSQQRAYQPKRPGLIGLEVEAKIPTKRLAKHIISYDGDIEEICTDFKNYGGTILEAEGVNFLIEVDSGTFSIHRCFVKKK